MRKADLTKRIMASAFVVAGLTMLGQDAKAQIVMPQSDNNDSGNLILDKKSKKISKSLKNIKLMGNSKYSEPADSHPELVNSHPEPADSHPGLVNSHPELVNSHPELVSGSNNNVTLNSFQGLSDGKNSKILNRVQNDRIFANGITTGGAAPTPTLDDLQSNASTVMPTLSGKYDLATEEGENTRSIVINGTTYYYTPNEDSQDKLNMLDYLAGSSSVPDALIVDTSATTEHYLFKAGETYYTFDTTKLPVSSYTGTTYSDFAFKNNPSDVATFENGASGNYDVKVSFDNNSDHTKYYNININPTKASHVGSKLSNINWSTTDPYSDPDKWEDYYSAGSKVTVGESTITGAIRMKMSHNGSVPEPSSWNKYFTYTYTKPTGYTITRARLNDNVTTDAVNKKVFAGITDEYPYNGAAIYNTNDLSAINITADFIGNYTSPNGAGGAIYNKSNAKIGSIVGNFIGNHSYFYGGAIANDGTIGSIIGDFVGNSTVFDYDGTARGGAIGNAYSATISSITGDFIGNFAYSATSSYGGAISNEGTISSITGDFIGNSAFSSSSTSYGGAISNEGTISSITGDFIGNSASSSSSYSYGGAIYNSSGKISSITGDFVGNYASASSESYGGAISNEGTISSITGDFIGNSASSSGSSDAYGGAIYNDNAISSITGDFIGNSASTSGPGSYANGGAIYNDGTITLAGNTFTGNYTQVGEGTDAVITPNSIYNAGIINIADGATVTINDGYDGLGEAQLNIGTSASSGSVFNLSVDNGTIQTDNLGTVANNGTINWDLDVDLTNTNSDKIAASFADVEGNNKSIIINAINLVTGTGSDKIEITLTDNAALKTAYTLSSDIMNHITKASSAVTYTVNNVTYDSATGKLIFNAPVILDSLALKVHTGDPKVREYNMTALETVGENLGNLEGDSGAKLDITGGGFAINGGTYTGITVASGRTLTFTNVSDVTGFANDTAVTNGGSLEITGSKFTSKIANNASMTLKGTNTLNGAISGTNGQTVISTGTTTVGADLSQKDLTVESGAGLNIAANNLNITNAVKNDGTVTLSDGTLKSSIANNEATTGKTVIDGNVTIQNGKTVSQAIEVNSGKKLTANAASIGGAVTNNATVELTGGELVKNISGTNGEVDITTGTVTNSAEISAKSVVINSTLNTAADKVSATDGITNNATLTLSAGEIQSNIQGTSNGIVNIAAGAEGSVTTTHNITDQTVNVNTGTLHLNLGNDYATQLNGSTVNVANGAILDTIDSAVNDYSSTVKLANGATVKADINFDGTNITIDNYGKADGTTSINLGAISAINVGNFQSGSVAITADGVTVNGESIEIFNQSGKTVTVKGSGTNNGRVLVSESTSTDKLNGAVYTSPTKSSITYTMLTGEDVNNDKPALGYIQDEFKIESNSSAVENRRTITAKDNTYGLIVEGQSSPSADDGKSLTINNIRFENFATGTVTGVDGYNGNYEGIITVGKGASLTVKDSYFAIDSTNTNKIAIANYGKLNSDPTTYEGAVENNRGAVATITGDTFSGIDRSAIAGANGGAIYNEAAEGSTPAGILTLNKVTASNNKAVNGGALYNAGTATINGGTYSGNSATELGGAIYTSTNLTINSDSTNGAVSFSGNTHNTATTAVANDIYMSGGTGTPIALNLNAANKTDKTISLGSGVNGTNYNVNVNNGTTGKVTIASLAGAGTIALKGGELDLTSDTTATALTASDATTLNASSTNGLSVGTLTVEDGKTFTNSGNLTVTSTLTNGHDGTGNTGTITNDGTLNLKGNTPPHNFENKGTINGNGTLVIGDGTTNKTLLSSTGNISNKITIMANSELDADPDQLTVTDGTLKNDGTLRLTGGTIKFNVANNTGTAGHTDITANSVDFDSTAHAINQQINIILDDSSTTGNSVLVADGANIGGNVAIDGGTETRDSILRLTGGTMNHNITGYTNPSTTLTTYGNVEITGNVAFASGKTAQVSELSVGLGKTLTNNGTFTVSEELTNSGTISNSGTGILNLLGGESATDTMANAGTINGTGKVNIGSYTSDTEKDVAYVVNTGSGSITGDITIAKESTLKTASDKVTDSNGLTNDGTLVFNNSADGDINQDISGSGTSSTGVVEIAAGNDVTVDMNGKTITNNTIKLTSGTLYTGDSTTGNVDLSGTTIEANGGTLSVQDGKTGTIKLGTVDTATNGKDLNVAIDADFMHNYTTNDRGIVGSADVISATSVTGTNKIHVSDIKLSWDTSADPAETNQHPIGTEFTAQIADSATKGAIDLTNTTTSITPGYRTGAGNILLTYNSSTGYLTGIHSTLNDAITSSVDTKMYYMDVMDGDTPLYTTVIDGPKTLNGNSLSITTSGNNITSVTAGNDGIVIGNASRILSIIGTNPDTTQPNTTISGFGTAIDNTSGGKVNLTDVTMTGNTKDIINNGHAADKGVYLAGTNNITSIVDSDGTHTHGQTTVKSGTSTIGTIQQKSVTVDAGATANLTNIANVATTDGITNNGDLVLAGGDATTVATNANKITMTAAAGNAKTTIAAGSNITNTAVMTQKEVEVSAATTTPAADAAKLANNSTINADTINVKADATLENNDGAKIFASNGADKASIVAEAGANIDLNKGSEATADVTLASSTSDLTITDNGKLSGGVKTSNGGSINLVADTQDISMNSAITGAITGADGTGNGSYKVTATSTPQTTPNTVTIDKAIAGATEVDVNADTVAVITDTAYTFTSAPVKVGNNGDLTLENTTSGETTVGSAISALTATDKFDVTVDNSANGGKTNINNTISGAETVTGNGGTTNLNSTITGADAVIAQAGTTNINTGAGSNTSAQIGTAKIDIKDGATAGVNTTSNNFVLDNNVEGETADSTLKLSGNSGTPGTASDPGTQFNIASDVNGGTVEIAQGQLNLPSEDKVANANGVKVDRGATLNTMNGATNNYNSNIKFEDASQVKVDVNAINKASDRFQNPQQASGAGVVLTDVAIQDLDKIVHRNTDIDLRGTTNLANITVGSELLNKKFQAMTPIRIMEATIDQNGMMNIHPSSGRNDYNSFNPAAVVGPIAAQMGGYLSQLNSYDEAFRNLDMKMLMTREERQAYKMANRYASGEAPSVFSETYLPEKSSAGWFRPYASFERVGLKHGPGVSNVMYGSYFGGDSAMKELRNGWDYQWSVYVGYNGSHQAYAGQSIYQNGGNLGATGVWYKDNFFTALTANVGASVANASTTFGSEDFPMLMSGVASKTGYNWELAKGKFIIQPSYLMSYTFVNTFDYTNAAGVRINSDPLHAINITPGLKFIGNLKNGWQPYAGVQMVWSIMDQTNFHANDIPLPQMSVKPYFQYGIGVQKRWGERFTGFFQAMLRNGGRNGVALSAGFRWALGKAPSAKSAVTPKTSKSKQTVVKQQDKKVIKSSSTKTSKLSSFLADMDGEQTYVVKVEK